MAVNQPTGKGPSYNSVQVFPFTKVSYVEVAGGGDPVPFDLLPDTSTIMVTPIITSPSTKPYVQIQRSADGVAKRHYEKDYVWGVVKGERMLTITMPVAGTAYIEIMEG